MLQRLDKILSSQGRATRSEAQRIIRSGKVTVDVAVCRDPSAKIEPDRCEISVNGNILRYSRYIYIMVNKPAGLLCVSRDTKVPTVMELLPAEMRRPGLFPAGRLDKDTVGLVIITNDGDFAHKMLSPKKGIVKRYLALIDRPVGDEEIKAFSEGTSLGDGTVCRPAELVVRGCGGTDNRYQLVEVAISEGRYHQVKRMFSSVGRTVLWLKRISIGGLQLDENLEEGGCRGLTREEIDLIFA